jgi:predicted Rossmann-fold nucleotide-binding protein
VQTGKVTSFPVILVGVVYWRGLIDWLRETMLTDGKINEIDLDLIHLTDDLDDVVATIRRHEQSRVTRG